MQVKHSHPTKGHCVLPVYQQKHESDVIITMGIKQNKKDTLASNTHNEHNAWWTDSASICWIFPAVAFTLLLWYCCHQIRTSENVPWEQVQWTIFETIYWDRQVNRHYEVLSSSNAWMHEHMSSEVDVCQVGTAGAGPLKCHQPWNIKQKHTHTHAEAQWNTYSHVHIFP